MVQELGKYESIGREFIKKRPHIAEEKKLNPTINFASLDFINSNSFQVPSVPQFHNLFSMSDTLTMDIGNPLDERKVDHIGKLENPSASVLEQEIYVDGATVVWSRAGHILKTFDYSEEDQLIQQVLFAWFPINSISDPTTVPAIDSGMTDLYKDVGEGTWNKSVINFNSKHNNSTSTTTDHIQRRTLCVVLQDCIKVHNEDGLLITIHIPFEIGEVVPLDVGILVSKYHAPDIMKTNRKGKGKTMSNLFSMATGSGNAHPMSSKFNKYIPPTNGFSSSVFVTITRPLRGACPVTSKDPPNSSATMATNRISALPEPLTNPQKLLFATTKSSETGRLPVIVTLNIKENKHCIWTYDRRKEKINTPSAPLLSIKRKTSTTVSNLSKKKMIKQQPSRKRQKYNAMDSPHAQFHEDYISDEESFFHETENERDIYHELLDPSEISLRLLWKESHGVKMAAKIRALKETKSKAFVTHDLNGEELICIMNYTLGNLQVINLSKATQFISNCIVFKTSAKDAIPIHATRDEFKDLLFMDATNALHLYIDNEIARYPVQLDNVVRFTDPVYDRFTAVLANGELMRYRLNYRPTTSLVRDCLAAIDCAATRYFPRIWSRFLKLTWFHPIDNGGDRLKVTEWQTLFVSLLSFLSLEKKGYYTGTKRSATSASAIRDIQLQQMKASNTEYVLNELGFASAAPILNYDFLLDENYIQGVPPLWLDQIIQISEEEEKSNVYMEPTEFVDIVNSLHVVYEDYRIKNTMRVHAKLLGYLLMQCSVILGNTAWIDYYKSQGLNPLFTGNLKFRDDEYRASFIEPPNIQVCLRQMTPYTSSNPTLLSSFGVNTLETSLSHYRNSYAQTIKNLWVLYGAINTREKSLLLERMVADHITRKDVEILIDAVAKPILDILNELKMNPRMHWAKEAYIVIGRDDIYKQLQTKVKVCDPNTDTFKLPFLKDSDHPQSMNDLMKDYAETEVNQCVYKSDVLNMETERLRFSFGGFIEKVRIMLDATQIPDHFMKEQPELADEDLAAEHLAQVTLLIERTLALATGRAIYAFGTHIPDLTKVLPIETIKLAAKILPLRTVVTIDEATLSKEFLDWPRFHNGVAAGLRMSPSNNVNDSWINFCNPAELDSQHGGLLLAMGLNGTLKKLPLVHWYRFMAQPCELVSIGFILGAAASYRGTKDVKVTKVLSVHIPALLPPQSATFNHSYLHNASCLLGMGLLYMNTCDRLMVSTMLGEIGKNAFTDPSYLDADYEGCALAAGFSLGFIVLGAGEEASGLGNLQLRNKLYSLLTGRSAGAVADMHRNNREEEQPTGSINLDITSPGATIALGLIYLKTENEHVADSVGILETSPYLNYVRPDFLLIRVVAKNLIMWSTILPSDEWIDSQLPDFITKEQTTELDIEVSKQARYNITAGACLSIGLRYAGSKNESAFRCLLGQLDKFMKLLNTRVLNPQQHITKAAVRTCVDVCCSAAAMVVAGSGNRELLSRLEVLHGRITEDMSFGNHMSVSMSLGLLFMGLGGYTLTTSNEAIAALLCAFYPFYPMTTEDNRYHLQAFRHLWVLAVDSRWLMPFDVDNKKPCRVPMLLEIYEDEGGNMPQRKVKQVRIEAPSVVPDYKLIKSIRLDGNRYWPLNIDMVEGKYQESIIKSGLIYVKRKPGKKSYEEDPYGKRTVSWIEE